MARGQRSEHDQNRQVGKWRFDADGVGIPVAGIGGPTGMSPVGADYHQWMRASGAFSDKPKEDVPSGGLTAYANWAASLPGNNRG